MYLVKFIQNTSSQNITKRSLQNFWKSKGQIKIRGTIKRDIEEVPH